MTLEINVTCRCGRAMRPDAAKGRGHMVCGCSSRVYVEVPNRMVYEHGMCAWVDGRRGCTDGALHPKIPLCEAHIRKAIDFAAEHRFQLAANLAERAKFRALKRDIEATSEQQERASLERRRQLALKQAGKIRDLIAAAGSVVYYVRLDPKRIKIGVSVDLAARMKAYRVTKGQVLAVEPGGQRLEMQRHREFADLRIQRSGVREEYEPGRELESWIERLRENHGEAYAAWRGFRLSAIADLREAGPVLFESNRNLYDDLERAERAAMESDA